MSTPILPMCIGTRMKPCTPSTCTRTIGFFPCASADSASMGWMAPVSLLTCMQETSAVFSSITSSAAARSTTPRWSIGSTRTSMPSFSTRRIVSLTAGCSIALHTKFAPPPCSVSANPRIARLSLSVPPEVKRISSSCAPSCAAMRFRQARISRSTSTAGLYAADGLKYVSRMHALITSMTLSNGRVVALLSR